jgi:Putative Sin3 binding protein
MATHSNIDNAIAFTGMTASVDIPNNIARDGDGSAKAGLLTAASGKTMPSGNGLNGLPTPPNSISPSLPPHAFKSRVIAPPGTLPTSPEVDSDIDLQDAQNHQYPLQRQHGFAVANNEGLAGLDASGAITPTLLSKHHLPEILLAHGPLAIRHVMGYLTTSVPGFSGIPPAKARRLVVGALEGRGNGGEGGGVNGDVIFEKVGWGRWDARLRGQPPRESRGIQQSQLVGNSNLSPPGSVPSSYSQLSVGALAIHGGRSGWTATGQPSASWGRDSAIFSHDEESEAAYPHDVTMLDDVADKMSLDGDESCSSSEAPDEPLDDDMGDDTDDEDWAQMGPAALRQGSVSASNGYLSTNVQKRGGSSVAMAKSMPPQFNNYNFQQSQKHTGFSSGFGAGSDSQEREAIEALLRLGSV